jgi:rubredoxin
MSDTAPFSIAPEARMECGVCWRVYDPAEGDPVWQIEPGVAFADLPADWRCPACDAPREKFLRCDDEH